jgi:non-ribosomal peptide synthetase-like protein
VSAAFERARMRSGTSWFGHPAFEMPRRAEQDVDRRLTFDPSPLRFVTRLVWELMRLVLPVPLLLALFAWVSVVSDASAALRSRPALLYAVVVPATSLAVAAVLVGVVVAIKWVLLGRVKPGRRAFWSCWCMRWDFLYEAWSAWSRPFLASLEGTLLLAVVLRAMGVKIGRRVALGPGFAHVVDPDMIEIGDDATVHALFQAHSFEDRVLKIDRIRVGRGASVSEGAVLFYGAEVGDGARVLPQSVVMKHEALSPGLSYEGCPTTAVAPGVTSTRAPERGRLSARTA